MIKVRDIAAAIEDVAPRSAQESWDNSGLQVGDPEAEVRGVLVSLDPTPGVIDEAADRGCNMVVCHHPLMFRGVKAITGATDGEQAIIRAIRRGVAVYSAHTSLDNVPAGASAEIARRLGAVVDSPMIPAVPGSDIGTGVVATLPIEMDADSFIDHVGRVMNVDCIKTTRIRPRVRRFAVCSGSGSSFIADAMRLGVDAYITGDVTYHHFLDNTNRLLIVDIGHYESEIITKDIFFDLLSEKFPNFVVHKAQSEQNPVIYGKRH